MKRRNNRIVAGLVAALVVAGLWIAAVVILPSDEELRELAVAAVKQRFGITVAIGSVHWQLLPAPGITLRHAKTAQEQPIVVRQLSVYPNLKRALLHRKFNVERLEVDGAVMPTASLAAFGGQQEKTRGNPYAAPVEHVRFRDVTWVARTGIPLAIEGEIDFDPLWRPRYAQVRRAGFTPEARITLERDGDTDRWITRVVLGTGTADGMLALASRPNGNMVLSGTLEPRGVEVASAAEGLNRRPTIGGKANGHTVVAAHGKTAGELGQSLRLRTEFTMAPATVLHFDLDKAIRTVGKEYAGQTTLQSFTGVMDLQNTGDGTVLRYTDMEAHAGSFTATGEATVFNFKLEAQGTLDLVQGVVGIPFTISGTTRHPKVSVPPGVFAGAAAGTAVLPGVGTVIGARIGGALGRLSGRRPEPPDTPKTEATPLEPRPGLQTSPPHHN